MRGAGYEAAKEADAQRRAYEADAVIMNDADPDGTPHWKWRLSPSSSWSEDAYATREEAERERGYAQAGMALLSPAPNPEACDGCGNVPDRWALREVTFQREAGGAWYRARWCDGPGSCLDMARAALRGETSYGALGLEPVVDLWTWTTHAKTCLSCGRTFRISEEALADARVNGYEGTDDEIAAAIECCIECIAGEGVPGEIVEPAPDPDANVIDNRCPICNEFEADCECEEPDTEPSISFDPEAWDTFAHTLDRWTARSNDVDRGFTMRATPRSQAYADAFFGGSMEPFDISLDDTGTEDNPVEGIEEEHAIVYRRLDDEGEPVGPTRRAPLSAFANLYVY